MKNKVIIQTNKPIVKARENITQEQASDINIYKEDLENLDKELVEADTIYNEIHSLYKNLTGGDYVPRNIRDVAELAKTVVNARQYHLQVVEKRINLKKTIADMNFRQNGGIDEASNEAVTATARAIISMVRSESGVEPKKEKKISKSSKNDQIMLDNVINERIASGELKLSKNDMLVGINDHAVIRYDRSSGEFVAIDERTGKIIPDFPEDRLPDKDKINRVSKGSVMLSDSTEIADFDPKEFEYDDDYEDNAP